VELAPNSLTARQLTGVLLLRQEDTEAALRHFQAAVKIADAQGKDGLLQVATTLNGEKDKAAALQLMRALSGDYPQKPSAYYALSILEVSQQRLDEAERSLRQAIALRPDWALPRVMLSRVLAASGRMAQAMSQLAEAVGQYPDDRLLRLSYARLLIGEHAFAKALEQFRELHQRDPADQEARYAYAMLATQQAAWDAARQLWQELRNDPKFKDEATYFLAQVEELNDNPDTAIGLYRSVGKGDFRVDAVIRAADLMAARGQPAQARELLTQARITHSERAVDLYVAETQILQKNGVAPAEVLALYDDALEAYPESDDLLYNRGLYFSDIGRFVEMEADFKAVLARDEDHAEALNALGYMLADRGVRLDEALTYILRAHKLKPDNSAILDSLGWAYYRKGEYALALQYLRQAIAGGEDDEISAHLGEVLWVSGEQDEAQSVWRAALEAAPESLHLRSVMERFLSK
jgi:tetratricopeptide (TPR) repeat protein